MKTDTQLIAEIQFRFAMASARPWRQWTCREEHGTEKPHSANCHGVAIPVLRASDTRQWHTTVNVTMPTEADDAFVANALDDVEFLLDRNKALEHVVGLYAGGLQDDGRMARALYTEIQFRRNE